MRITVAILIAVLALIVASSDLVTTTDAVEDEVIDAGSTLIQKVFIKIGVRVQRIEKRIVDQEVVSKTLIVVGIDSLSLVGIATRTGKDVAPSTHLVIIAAGVVDELSVTTESTNDLTDVERGQSVVSGIARLITVTSVRAELRAVEGGLARVVVTEVITISNLATVLPTSSRVLVVVLARLNVLDSSNASVKVATKQIGLEVTSAAETQRGIVGVGEDLQISAGDDTEVSDVALRIDIKQITVVGGREHTESTILIRTRRTIVNGVEVLVDRVVNTGDVVAITASALETARLVLRVMFATVARITVAIEVTVGSVAGIDAATSSSGSGIRVAGDISRSEVTRVDGLQHRAIVGSNKCTVVLAVSNVGTLELVMESAVGVSKRINNELIIKGLRILLEVRAVDDLVKHVVRVGSTPVLPEVSAIEVGDVTKSLGALLAERAVVFATSAEVSVAVEPARGALELALTGPVMTRLTIARLNPSEVIGLESIILHEGTAVEGTTTVVDGSLATVLPVASLNVNVHVLAESRFANAQIALAALSVADAFRPIPGVETIKSVAFSTFAVGSASAVVEDINLATSHGVLVTVPPAGLGIANVVALTSVVVGGVVDASDPGLVSVLVEVRAGEDVAVSSHVVIGSKRPELEERAPDTANLRAFNVAGLLAVDEGIVRPVLTVVHIVVSEMVVEAE